MDGRQGDGGMMLDSNVQGEGMDAVHQKVQYVCGCKYLFKNLTWI